MLINNFLRFTETMKVKQEKRVVSVTVKPVLSDCTGTLYITDLQLQECGKLTGYTLHTSEMLPTGERPLRWHNGVVRSSATVILFNLGETSAALDCYLYPFQSMAAESTSLAQGWGSHRAVFLSAVNADDELALKASTRECLKNDAPTQKYGFYQYTAACDSKHLIKLEDHKAARLYLEYWETKEGAIRA